MLRFIDGVDEEGDHPEANEIRDIIADSVEAGAELVAQGLDHPDPDVRIEVVDWFLEHVAIQDVETAQPLFEKAFSDEDGRVRDEAVSSLVGSDGEGVLYSIGITKAWPLLEAAREAGL